MIRFRIGIPCHRQAGLVGVRSSAEPIEGAATCELFTSEWSIGEERGDARATLTQEQAKELAEALLWFASLRPDAS